ncbi:MAG: hypothetical protein K5745_00150 [Saccharofermentans sp.]|nr:hypothetical protein [Saccharofermentans sp.]
MLKTIVVALILCLIEITVIVVASPLAKPALVLGFLPEDVRLAAKDHKEPAKWKQIIAHALLAFFLIAMFAGLIYLGIDGLKNGYGFWKLTLRFIILLYIMKAFDIIVQDQWLVMTVGYFKKIFPETSDCDGWKDRGFNNKNQIVRIVAYPFLCMITAGIFMLFR